MKNKNNQTALIFGILAIVTFIIFPLSLVFGILGIVFYCKSKKENESGVAPLILSIIGLVLSIIFMIGLVFVGMFAFNNVKNDVPGIENHFFEEFNEFKNTLDYGILKKDVESFKEDLENEETILTIVVGENCNSCYEYYEEIEDMGSELGVPVYWFNLNKLTSVDKDYLNSKFPILETNKNYPITLIIKNGNVINTKNGYIEDDELEMMIKTNNI